MTNDILRYIAFLEDEYGLFISIHNASKRVNRAIDKLAPYNIHRHPYCLFIKEERDRHLRCVEYQNILREYKRGVARLCCPCGVTQFILPIRCGEEYLGFVCVSGYRGDDRYFEQYAYRKGLCYELLLRRAESLLPTESVSEEKIETLVKPLCAMLSILLGSVSDSADTYDGDLYNHILSVIHGSIHQKELSIDSIAATCYCSKSMVSHLFKKRMNTSVNRYISRLRMERAEGLLLNTDMSVTEVAYSCGYADSNYFIYVFGKSHGTSPLKYRRLFQNSKNNSKNN